MNLPEGDLGGIEVVESREAWRLVLRLNRVTNTLVFSPENLPTPRQSSTIPRRISRRYLSDLPGIRRYLDGAHLPVSRNVP